MAELTGPTRRRLIVLVSLALFALALAIRLPGLWQVPRFEDEGDEAIWALEIATGQRFPLTGAYYGPFFSYLLASVFAVFGVNLLWPRLLIAVFGALTVPAVFNLGRVVRNWRVGVVAATLALASPALVLISSHYGWSNSLTPFLTTVALTAVFVGVTERRAGVLALGGVMTGLAMQAHPLCSVLVPAIVLWYCLSIPRREWLTRHEVYAGIAGLVVGYAPMLWSFVTAWGALAARIQTQTYAFAPVTSLGSYAKHLEALVLTVPLWTEQAFRDVVVVAAALVALTFRVRSPLFQPKRLFLPCIFFLSIVLLPLITGFFLARYVAFLLPVAFLWIADVVVERWDRHEATNRARARTLSVWHLVPPYLLLAAVIVVPLKVSAFTVQYQAVLLPITLLWLSDVLVRLWDRRARAKALGAPGRIPAWPSAAKYALVAIALSLLVRRDLRSTRQARGNWERTGATNAVFFEVRDTLRTRRACHDGIFMEAPDHAGVKNEDWPWVFFNIQAVRFMLTFDSCSPEVARPPALRALLARHGVPAWLVVADRNLPGFADQFDLVRVAAIAPGPQVPADLQLALYQVTALK